MAGEWFRPRRYKHVDRSVNVAFAQKVEATPSFVERHAFSPLIHYTKPTKRYRPGENRTVVKERPIMYASHRDACILSCYSWRLQQSLEEFYRNEGLAENVIAYRSLGKANYDFSAAVFEYAKSHSPCKILAFDVSGFFDTLDHRLLKARLIRTLGAKTLPLDWYQVFKSVTKFHFLELSELKQHPTFSARLKQKSTAPIATVAEIKEAGIRFYSNKKPGVGIPQGTPISASLSNLYMMDFDFAAKRYCDSIGALYRRYSDDILVVCSIENAKAAEAMILKLISDENLQINASKTERTEFAVGAPAASRTAQYLGFAFSPSGAGIRASSLSKQWRKMRWALKRTEKAAEAAIATGKSTRVYTKKLRKRFSPLQFRNFSSYARRSAQAFGAGNAIPHQIRRLESEFEGRLREIKKLNR